MSLFNRFLNSLKSHNEEMAREVEKNEEEVSKTNEEIEADLDRVIKEAKSVLLDESQYPSKNLSIEVNKLGVRAKEPMKVAITGQFSSGKSTFLNALLSKDILPTGVTPVTSKVNYIKYGDRVSLRVTYKDGRDEDFPLKEISKFTDQREDVEDIDYLTLFSPYPILKDITFVDTPGLNSQSESDTEVTDRVLQEVDGIIWLTLIDNAGKRSEEKILDKYLKLYKNKSLCVLNQKDKFDNEDDINESLEYVTNKFGKYFGKVVAISARQALQSRSHDKERLVDDEITGFLDVLRELLKNDVTFEALNKLYQVHEASVGEIRSKDDSEKIKIYKDSNIEDVLRFINIEIKPKAHESKEYAIKQEIRSLTKDLIEENRQHIEMFQNLQDELAQFDSYVNAQIDQFKIDFGKRMESGYRQVESMLEKISNEIYKNIKEETRVRYFEGKKSLLGTVPIEKEEYTFYMIDKRKIITTLFETQQIVKLDYIKYKEHLKNVSEDLKVSFEELLLEIQTKIQSFQREYENFQKTKNFYSTEKNKFIQNFASKAYENLLKIYNDEILIAIGKLECEFRHLQVMVGSNYKSATFQTLGLLEDERENARKSYESNPRQFPFTTPSNIEINRVLQEDFEMTNLKKSMYGNLSFLSKQLEATRAVFHTAKVEKEKFLDGKQIIYRKNLENLQSLEEKI
ncbi:MAG: dynamin family protein [Campylobacterales bacterium]|nr:dynamin family protein [Campylobacterales bacterium]